MFGIGPLELAVVAIVAIVFIGPQKLPEMMSKFGKLFVQVRRQTQDIRTGFNDVIRDAERDLELDRIRKLKDQLEDVKPANMIENAIKDTVSLDDDKKEEKDEYHDSHYVDGKYQGDGDGFVDAESFLEQARKRDAEILKPKTDANLDRVAAADQEPGKPIPPPPANTQAAEKPNIIEEKTLDLDTDEPAAPPPPPKPS